MAKPNRTKLVQARLNHAEFRDFRRLARDLGFTDGEFIRAMLDVHVRVRAETIAAKAKAQTEAITAAATAETVAAVKATRGPHDPDYHPDLTSAAAVNSEAA